MLRLKEQDIELELNSAMLTNDSAKIRRIAEANPSIYDRYVDAIMELLSPKEEK